MTRPGRSGAGADGTSGSGGSPAESHLHRPVMVEEILGAMPGDMSAGTVVDATVGGGGHMSAILDRFPEVRVVGIDRDPEAVDTSRRRLSGYRDRAAVVLGNFRDMDAAMAEAGVREADAVIFDLGVSAMQIRNHARGFSFSGDGPLDMRMGPDTETTAKELIEELDERELGSIIKEFGEDLNAKRIARRIILARDRGEMKTTGDLVRAVLSVTPPRKGPARNRSIHPSTRTFQALRIAVNGEMSALELALPQAARVLRPGGRLAAISFHSLEDRRVKQFIVRESHDCVCPPGMPVCRCGHARSLRVITRKPVMAGESEVRGNPEARSAKLRVAEKI